MWFGDHTFSQVEVDRLKTLSDGLRTLDDKARKKKYKYAFISDSKYTSHVHALLLNKGRSTSQYHANMKRAGPGDD